MKACTSVAVYIGGSQRPPATPQSKIANGTHARCCRGRPASIGTCLPELRLVGMHSTEACRQRNACMACKALRTLRSYGSIAWHAGAIAARRQRPWYQRGGPPNLNRPRDSSSKELWSRGRIVRQDVLGASAEAPAGTSQRVQNLHRKWIFRHVCRDLPRRRRCMHRAMISRRSRRRVCSYGCAGQTCAPSWPLAFTPCFHRMAARTAYASACFGCQG